MVHGQEKTLLSLEYPAFFGRSKSQAGVDYDYEKQSQFVFFTAENAEIREQKGIGARVAKQRDVSIRSAVFANSVVNAKQSQFPKGQN